MRIEQALVTYLLAQSGLTPLIDRRFYFDILPQNCMFPAVVCQTISNVFDHFLTEQSTLESPMIQFTVYAATKSAANSIADQIKTALQDYTGLLSTLVTQYVKLVNEIPSADTTTGNLLYTVDLEFEINFIKE